MYICTVRGELNTGREIAEQLFHLAHKATDDDRLLSAHSALAYILPKSTDKETKNAVSASNDRP
jgi:hypothetical protein